MKKNPQDLLYNKYKHLVIKAAQLGAQRYKVLGSSTYDDLIQEASLGFLAAIRSPRFVDHPNKPAYIYTFCYGYITHHMHRKTRVVRISYKELKTGQSFFHIPLDHELTDKFYADNTPESFDIEAFPQDAVDFVYSISDTAMRVYDKEGILPSKAIKKLSQLQDKYND
jgi:hypothetical protein